jgi:hypothetical protein
MLHNTARLGFCKLRPNLVTNQSPNLRGITKLREIKDTARLICCYHTRTYLPWEVDMQISRLSIFAFIGSILVATAGGAASSCTDWMDQGDGTSWTTCVDDSGVQHCYKINNTPGSTAYEVSCSS